MTAGAGAAGAAVGAEPDPEPEPELSVVVVVVVVPELFAAVTSDSVTVGLVVEVVIPVGAPATPMFADSSE